MVADFVPGRYSDVHAQCEAANDAYDCTYCQCASRFVGAREVSGNYQCVLENIMPLLFIIPF